MEGGGHAGPNITLQPLSLPLLHVITFTLIEAQTGPFSSNIKLLNIAFASTNNENFATMETI